MIDQVTLTRLIDEAIAARSNAYAPYSVYPVGAAILSEDGAVFTGCNVENASYGLTVCAERNAVAAMVKSGSRIVLAIALATKDGSVPCGACLQVLAEFASEDGILVVCVDEKNGRRDTSLKELAPHLFTLSGSKH